MQEKPRDQRILSFPGAPKLIDFASFCLYYECLRFISLDLSLCCLCGIENILGFSMKRAILQSDNKQFRRLSGATAAVIWIVSTTIFAPCSLAAAADLPTGKPRIQGGNVRIEFD